MGVKLGTSGVDLRLGTATPATVRLGSSHIWSPPMAISGLHSWYDFADAGTMTLNGGNISQIADKSGNGKVMTQATAAAQPALTANALNGRSAATFTGTQWLQAATAADWKFLHYGADKSLVFAVIKADGGISDFYELLGTTHSVTSPGLLMYWSGGDSLVGATTATQSGNANYAETAPSPFMDTPHAICLIGDPAASGADRLLAAWQGDRDAEEMTFHDWDNSPQDAAPTNPMTVGRSGTGAAAFWTPYEGLVCEVLIYKRSTAFTSGERSKVFDYLVAKWGL